MAAPGTITKSKIVVLCLICILISSFITYSLASSLSTTFTISSGVYPGAPSYTVYQVNGVTYAKDQNGYNEFSGTNAATVIQAALTNGDLIVLSGDLGTMASELTVADNKEIVGANNAVLRVAADNHFIFKGASPNNVKIRNIDFTAITVGRSVEPIGIDLSVLGGSGATNVLIEDCSFNNFVHATGTPSAIRGKYDTLRVINNDFISEGTESSSYQLYLDSCKNVKIIGNMFNNNVAGNCVLYMYGSFVIVQNNYFVQTSNHATQPIEQCMIAASTNAVVSGNVFKDYSISGVDVWSDALYPNSSDITITGNVFETAYSWSPTGRGAVSITAAGGTLVDRVNIANNVVRVTNGAVMSGFRFGESTRNDVIKANIINNWVEGASYPIALYGTAFNVRLIDNTFRNNINPPYIEGGTLYAKFNEGYVTENRGTSTGTGAQQTIAHGLAGDLIPNHVTVVPTVTGATVTDIWADATNIYCTVTSGKAFKWSALVT